MSFSRNFLKSAGLTDEQVAAVMEEHVAVVDALKQQRDEYKADADKYKADAEKLPDVQKQLDALKGGEDYKAKYEKEHTDFESYKTQVAKEAEEAKVKAAYRKLLTEEKISEKRLDAVIRLTDFSGMKLDKDGNLENADQLRKTINSEWGEYKVTTRTKNADVSTPPEVDNGGKGMSRAKELANNYYAQKYGVVSNTQQKE